MKTCNQLQTMQLTFQEICSGETPWVALGNFMNDWFDYAKDQRDELIANPLFLPVSPDSNILRWAAFCTASVEWLCERYRISCPDWVHDPAYSLPEPWFDSPGAYKLQVRERLLKQTPEPFARRNIYCGNRMFHNKYEFAEQERQRLATA